MLGTAGASSTFEAFEKNYGITRDDYLSRMFGSNGSRDTLSDMLSSQLSAEKLKEAFDTADALGTSGRPSDFSVDLGAKPMRAPAATLPSLRSKLKSALTAKQAEPEYPSPAPTAGSRANDDHLEPLAGQFSVEAASAEGSAGLSLFEVVHLKYEELSKHHRPR